MIRTTIAILMATALAAHGQNILSNSGFENGPFTGTTVPFGGGTAIENGGNTPTSWSWAAGTNGDPEAWVDSTQAYGGSKYMFLSSTRSTESGLDACIYYDGGSGYSLTGLNGSVDATSVLSFCLFAADGIETASQLNIEIIQYRGNGNAITPTLANQDPGVIGASGGLMYKPFAIPINANGWTVDNNTAIGGIPWQQYCIDFKLESATRNVKFWLSASVPTADDNSSISSIVLDNATLMVVPEPSSGLMCILGLSAFILRRRTGR